MPTLRQLEANRRNALKSTGPRTPEGKAVVAENAITHGIFCGSLLTEGDDPAMLQQLAAGLMADITPRNTTERVLAERIISATWRLRKLGEAERFMHNCIGDHQRNDLAAHGEYPEEAPDHEERHKLKKTREQDQAWENIKQRRRDWANTQICPAGFTLAVDLEQTDCQIERYSRYEKRLEGTIHRAWRELRLMRKDAEQQPPSPLAGEGGGEGEKVQTPETVPPPETQAESAPRESTPMESAPLTPHPNPLPQGEREQDAASTANVQNKPNSGPNEELPEVYGAMRAEPVEVSVTPGPSPAQPTSPDAPTG